jgi:type II secretory pathway component PulJ
MSEVEDLEFQLEQTKVLKTRMEMVERLLRNHDFRTLILDGFCRDDAARFVQESGDPALNDKPGAREDCLAMAQASGHLKRYLQMQIQMGRVSERTISELEAVLAEVRSQEGAE